MEADLGGVAMENSILRYLKGCDGELYGRIVRTLKVYRGIDFEAIGQM